MLGFLRSLMDELARPPGDDHASGGQLGAGDATTLRVELPHNRGTAEHAVAALQAGKPSEGSGMRMNRCVAELTGTVLTVAVTAKVTISDSTVTVEATYDKPWIVPQALIENRVKAALVAALR